MPTGALSASGLTPNKHRHNVLHRGSRLFSQCIVVVVGDRMADHCERITLQTVQVANRLGCAREPVGDDRYGRNAEPLRFNGVVQTARRATPSIADCSEPGLRPRHFHPHRFPPRPRARGFSPRAATNPRLRPRHHVAAVAHLIPRTATPGQLAGPCPSLRHICSPSGSRPPPVLYHPRTL